MSPVLSFVIIVIAGVLGASFVSAINVRREAMNEDRLPAKSFVVIGITAAVIMAVMLFLNNIVAGIVLVISLAGMIVVLSLANRNIGVVSRRLGNNPSGKLSFRIWLRVVAFVGIIYILSAEQLVGWINPPRGFNLVLQVFAWAPPLIAAALLYRWAALTDRQQIRTSDQPAQPTQQSTRSAARTTQTTATRGQHAHRPSTINASRTVRPVQTQTTSDYARRHDRLRGII